MISVFITTGSGETSVHSFAVAEGMQFRVGRDECCEISLPHETHLSRIHCVICYTNGQLTITDHQSSNGVFLNNQRIVSDFLMMDQPYRLGNCTMVVRETEGEGGTPSPPYAASSYPSQPAVYPQQTLPPTQGYPPSSDYLQPSPTQSYPATPNYPQQQVPAYPQTYPQSYPQQPYPSSPYPAVQPYAQQGYVPMYGTQQGYPQQAYPMQGYASMPQTALGPGLGYPVQQQAQMPVQGYEYTQPHVPNQPGYPTEYQQQAPQLQDFQQQQAYAQPAYQELPQAYPQAPYNQQVYATEPQDSTPSSEPTPQPEQLPNEGQSGGEYKETPGDSDEPIEDMLARELEDSPEPSASHLKWDRIKTIIAAWIAQLLHWLKNLRRKAPTEEAQEDEEETDDEVQQEGDGKTDAGDSPSPADGQAGDAAQEAPPQESSPEDPKD